MQIHSLEKTPIQQLTECFNKAFENYFVPLKLDEEQIRNKIKSENILFENSAGVTIDNELAGFILIGIDFENRLAYNGGTGIIPSYRGQKLTEKMYAFLLPQLKKMRVQTHLLEVICENRKAMNIYGVLGYAVTRKVICYKGKISDVGNAHVLREIKLPKEAEVERFWNHKPTYQNTLFYINNNPGQHKAFGAFENDTLIGYIIFDKDSLRVKQFGVAPNFRNTGIGHQLFYQVQQQNPETTVVLINVDENDRETNSFLHRIGFEKLIEQYEMCLETK